MSWTLKVNTLNNTPHRRLPRAFPCAVPQTPSTWDAACLFLIKMTGVAPKLQIQLQNWRWNSDVQTFLLVCLNRRLCCVNHILIELIPILVAIKVTACLCNHMDAYRGGNESHPSLTNYPARKAGFHTAPSPDRAPGLAWKLLWVQVNQQSRSAGTGC